MFLTLNHYFHLKWKSSIHNISNSPEKVISPEYTDQVPFTSEISPLQFYRKMSMCEFWCKRWQQWWTFFTRGSVFIDYGFLPRSKIKLMMPLFPTNMQLFIQTDGLESLLEDCCDASISCLDSHSDGTHSLRRNHWWANVVILNFFKSVPKKRKKKQIHFWMTWGWINDNYWLNHSFNR